MAGLTDDFEIPRKTLVLFFLIDTSGSMEGEKIGAVNVAIQNAIPDIKDVAEENADAQIKIAALKFSDFVEWLTPDGPVDVEHFYWNFVGVEMLTAFGAACRALNEKLSTKAFMAEATGCFAPVIILLTDGQPSDEWTRPLADLKQNRWFKLAIKVALAIGDDADKNVLKQFTGNPETVIEVKNQAKLKALIRFVSVRASEIASKSSNAGAATTDDDKQDDFVEALEEFEEDWGADPAPAADDEGW